MTRRLVIAWLLLVHCVWSPGSRCAAIESAGNAHSVEATLASFAAHPSVVVELVAVEPAVVDPVAMQFDEHGRLWVVEMGDYPGNPESTDARGTSVASTETLSNDRRRPAESSRGDSRIRVLEDRDRDGRYETAQLFADRLRFATGVQPWRDGVIVTLAGEVAFLRDTDGDLAVDEKETWFRGFAQQNPQLRANDPTYATDGWVYLATGLRGGTIHAVHPRFASANNGEPISIDRSGFRFHPQSGQAEAIAGESQYGIALDAWGNRFVCDNRHPLQHVVLERRYLPPLAPLGWTKTVEDVLPSGEKSRLFPHSRQETTSYLHEGQFTAACGIHIHQGPELPAEFEGNAFVCEPTANLVHRATLERSGATFRGERGRPGAEFLTSTDSWFRPVFLADGPDGALYVVDMCRAVIEHPDWMPDLTGRTDLRDGEDHGRIWRVRRRDSQAVEELTWPAHVNTEALIAMLGSANQWQRRTAARLLLQDPSEELRTQLKVLLQKSPSPLARAAAVQMLAALHALPSLSKRLIDEERPEVRRLIAIGWEEHRAQAAGKDVAAALDQMLRSTLDAPDWLQFQTVLTAGRARCETPIPTLQKQAANWSDRDEWQQAAMLSALAPHAEDALLRLATDFRDRTNRLTKRQTAFVARLAQLAAADGKNALARSLEEMSAAPSLLFHDDRITLFGRALCQGAAQGISRQGQSFGQWLTRESHNVQSIWSSAINAEVSVAQDDSQQEDERLAALDLLTFADATDVRDAVLNIATLSESLPLRSKAIDVLAPQIKLAEVDRLIESLSEQSPRIRAKIFSVLTSREETAMRLLDRIKADPALADDAPPTERIRLRTHPIIRVRERASRVLPQESDDDRSGVVEQYLPALKLPANVVAGRKVFAERCAGCHRVDGVGAQVGPDIADTYNKSREYLLVAILDPNRAIDGSYVAYTVVTTAGQTYSGLISSESAATVALSLEEGKEILIPRAEIQQILPSRHSFMPSGLEQEINQRQMADLIAFLKGWRRDESVE